MSTAIRLQTIHPVSTPPLHQQLTQTICAVTASSTHSYEIAVRRLLEDLSEYSASGALDNQSYHAMLGTAMDVLFFFNYDLESLAYETNLWYRADTS